MQAYPDRHCSPHVDFLFQESLLYPPEEDCVGPDQSARTVQADLGRYNTQRPYCLFSRGTDHIIDLRYTYYKQNEWRIFRVYLGITYINAIHILFCRCVKTRSYSEIQNNNEIDKLDEALLNDFWPRNLK